MSKEGSIIVPNKMTLKNAILTRAMTYLSEEDRIGKEIFNELSTLLDVNDNKVTPDLEKPDWNLYMFAHIGITKDGPTTTPLDRGECAYMLNKLWNDYISPLQKELSELRDKEVRGDRMIVDLEHDKAILKSELKYESFLKDK